MWEDASMSNPIPNTCGNILILSDMYIEDIKKAHSAEMQNFDI